MTDNLGALIEQFGYLAVMLGCVIEGESALLLGTLAVHQDILAFPGILLAGLIGGIIGDNLWFYLGRFLGQPFIARHPRWQARAAFAKHHLDRYGASFIIGMRFFYGLRSVTPFVIGAANVSRFKFFLFDVLGCLVWISVMGTILLALGTAIEQALTMLQSERGALALTLTGITVFLVVCGLLYWRARVARRVEEEEM